MQKSLDTWYRYTHKVIYLRRDAKIEKFDTKTKF
jgi:hypothetical protein